MKESWEDFTRYLIYHSQHDLLPVKVSQAPNVKNPNVANRKRYRDFICFGYQSEHQPPGFFMGIRNVKLGQAAAAEQLQAISDNVR